MWTPRQEITQDFKQQVDRFEWNAGECERFLPVQYRTAQYTKLAPHLAGSHSQRRRLCVCGTHVERKCGALR